jgi:hypothetical protein
MLVLFALIAFLNVLPLALGFESLRNLLFRARLTTVLPKIPKWNHIMWLFVITPSIIIVFVFGVVMYGSSAHFRSFHGVGLPSSPTNDPLLTLPRSSVSSPPSSAWPPSVSTSPPSAPSRLSLQEHPLPWVC